MNLVVAIFLAGAAGLLAGVLLMASVRRRASLQTPAAGRVGAPPPNAHPRLAAAALEALHVATLVVDKSGAVLLCNPAGRKMGLVRGDELTLNDLRNLADTARRTGTAQEAEVRLLHGWWPRDPAAVRARAVPLGRTGYVALLVEDVTDARRVADMRRNFIANVSHELKTPVGALSLLAEALQQAHDDPQAVRRFADRMHHESTRLARLVTELIELSRLEAAEPGVAPAVSPVRQLVVEAIDRTRLAAVSRHVAVMTDIDPSFEVAGNREQLVTALVNLLDNAISYSPEHTQVSIAAHRRHTIEDSPTVEIAVIDQGIGIAEADLDRIFERFYRADPARSRATGGTGLGLAIVKHIAANHGGRVSVQSQVGYGSTFTLVLPATQPSPDTTNPHALASLPTGTVR